MLHDVQLELALLNQIQFDGESLYSRIELEDLADKTCKEIFINMKFRNGDFDISSTEESIKTKYSWLRVIINCQYMGAPHQLIHRLRELRARREAQQFKSKADPEGIPAEFIEKSNDIRRMLESRSLTKESLAERIKNGVPKTSTGFKRFDYLCNGGLENSGMMVIAAMPGLGKSALAINIAKNKIAEGMSICFLSLEMSAEAITTRLMQNFWNETESRVKQHAEDMITMSGDFHPVMPSNDIDKLLAEATGFLECDLFIIDYFDLITSKSQDNHSTKLESISHKIKDFAFRNKKPVILLSQLNKDLEKSSSNREPVLSDLHGTSALAKDAHIISFLWDKNAKGNETKDGDEHLDDGKNSESGKDIRWVIKKNRNGMQGMVCMDFEPTTMTFNEVIDTTFRL